MLEIKGPLVKAETTGKRHQGRAETADKRGLTRRSISPLERALYSNFSLSSSQHSLLRSIAPPAPVTGIKLLHFSRARPSQALSPRGGYIKDCGRLREHLRHPSQNFSTWLPNFQSPSKNVQTKNFNSTFTALTSSNYLNSTAMKPGSPR